MQQIERFAELQDALIAAISGDRKQVWTALPGIVQDYSASGPYAGTCTIKSALTLTFTDPETGVSAPVTIPPLQTVPVIYMGGGGMVTTYPIQPGDEALVIFSSRCIDAWWKYGGVQPQAEFRMHDLSDGFALIGPRSLARSIPNVSTTTAQFRSLDGSTYFEVAPSGVANVVAPGGVNIKGPVNIQGAVSITGNVAVTGQVTATQEGTFNSITVSTHTHSGVASGGSMSGPPVG